LLSLGLLGPGLLRFRRLRLGDLLALGGLLTLGGLLGGLALLARRRRFARRIGPAVALGLI